jgi:hypothetical protein
MGRPAVASALGPIALEAGVDQDGHGTLYVSAGYSPTRR